MKVEVLSSSNASLIRSVLDFDKTLPPAVQALPGELEKILKDDQGLSFVLMPQPGQIIAYVACIPVEHLSADHFHADPLLEKSGIFYLEGMLIDARENDPESKTFGILVEWLKKLARQRPGGRRAVGMYLTVEQSKLFQSHLFAKYLRTIPNWMNKGAPYDFLETDLAGDGSEKSPTALKQP